MLHCQILKSYWWKLKQPLFDMVLLWCQSYEWFRILYSQVCKYKSFLKSLVVSRTLVLSNTDTCLHFWILKYLNLQAIVNLIWLHKSHQMTIKRLLFTCLCIQACNPFMEVVVERFVGIRWILTAPVHVDLKISVPANSFRKGRNKIQVCKKMQ